MAPGAPRRYPAAMEGSRAVLAPPQARCEVLVLREGLLSAVAHDLLLRVTAFEIAVDLGTLGVVARLDPASLRVVTALRDGRPLPDALRPGDVREIEATIAGEILRAPRHREIRFASTRVLPTARGYDVHGTLELRGVARPLALDVRRADGRLETEATLHQPDFGIAPYRAMLGTLRVRADVVVRVSTPEP